MSTEGVSTSPSASALLRALVAVLAVDASATSLLAATARRARARGRPSASAFSGIAVVAAASLVPGAVAVLREVRAHSRPSRAPHTMRPTIALLLSGALLNTVGTALLLRVMRPEAGSTARRADLLLLAGGDLIVLPYAAIVWVMHARERDRIR